MLACVSGRCSQAITSYHWMSEVQKDCLIATEGMQCNTGVNASLVKGKKSLSSGDGNECDDVV